MQKKPTKSKEKKTPNKPLNNYARYSRLAIQMIAIIVGGTFGGLKLDEWTAMEFPVFTLVGAVLSVVFAIYFAIKDFIKP